MPAACVCENIAARMIAIEKVHIRGIDISTTAANRILPAVVWVGIMCLVEIRLFSVVWKTMLPSHAFTWYTARRLVAQSRFLWLLHVATPYERLPPTIAHLLASTARHTARRPCRPVIV